MLSRIASEVKCVAIDSWAMGKTGGKLKHGEGYKSLADFGIK